MNRDERERRSREARRDLIQVIKESQVVDTIRLEAWLRSCGYGFLDDEWDQDGDSIVVTCEKTFPLEGDGIVQASFAQGADPQFVARVLRKMADMLESPVGSRIANLGLMYDPTDYAYRLRDGAIRVTSRRQERAEHERQREQEDGEADAETKETDPPETG